MGTPTHTDCTQAQALLSRMDEEIEMLGLERDQMEDEEDFELAGIAQKRIGLLRDAQIFIRQLLTDSAA